MIPDYPQNIRIRLARLFFLFPPDVVLSLPYWLSQFIKAKLRQPTGQRQSNVRTQQKKIIGPILFLYYEESLVSSNLNSNLLRLHCAHPNDHTMFKYVSAALCIAYKKLNNFTQIKLLFFSLFTIPSNKFLSYS